MESVRHELSHIMDRFPAHRDRIKGLYKNDPDFKALCADYFLCINTLHKYQAESTEKQCAVKEYSDVRKDLESELQNFIFNKDF
jgi:hypothetical protein